MFDFKGKSVLITSTAQGCGRVCAEASAEQGANVAMCDVNDDGGKETLAAVEAAGANGPGGPTDLDEIRAVLAAGLTRKDETGKKSQSGEAGHNPEHMIMARGTRRLVE